jgi:hypothetical protein
LLCPLQDVNAAPPGHAPPDEYRLRMQTLLESLVTLRVPLTVAATRFGELTRKV